MKINDDHLERLIKKALKEELDSAPPPPLSIEEAWKELNKKRTNNKEINPKKTLISKKSLLYVASLLFIFAALFSFSPLKGSAFSSFTEILQKVQGTVTQLFVKVGNSPEGDDGAPTSEELTIVEGSDITSKSMSLEEAQKVTAFPITLPKQVPEKYSFENVIVSKRENELSKDIYINYENDKHKFTINKKLVGDSFGSGITADSDDTKVEQVEINGEKGSLLQYKNGIVKLIWVTQQYYYSISGQLTIEEVIKVAESM